MDFCFGLFVGVVAGLVAGICLMWEQREIEMESKRDRACADTPEARARGAGL